MKMVGKAQQVQDNQNKKKEDATKVFRAAMRRILISKAPPVLTINLNRFSQDSHGRYKKLKGHVRFKEMLDIQPFMDPRYCLLLKLSIFSFNLSIVFWFAATRYNFIPTGHMEKASFVYSLLADHVNICPMVTLVWQCLIN